MAVPVAFPSGCGFRFLGEPDAEDDLPHGLRELLGELTGSADLGPFNLPFSERAGALTRQPAAASHTHPQHTYNIQ